MAVEIVNALRVAFNTGKSRTYEWRIQQLNAMLRLLNENVDEICDALASDLHKPRYEAIIAEVNTARNEAAIAINNLRSWMKPEVVPKTMFTMTDSTTVLREPFGVTLIMGAWNYPVQLTFVPMIGAIAAGNCVLLKPSEVAKACEGLVCKLLDKYMDRECVRTYCAGPTETQALLDSCRFDKIFYTGNGTVARIVMQAAAKNLTPVTLELGGKSPTFIDESCDLPLAARRVMWGKYINCGQTCIAPDYVIIPRGLQDRFVSECKAVLKEYYGEDAEKSPDYGRIINERHTTRIANMMKETKGKTALGGRVNTATLYIEPTVVVDVNMDDALMQQEIFGPVLPIVNAENASEAIQLINGRSKPLALYIFSHRSSVHHAFRTQTSSGSIVFNDTLIQVACDGMPFGGVGESGCGSYHGHYSFEEFSHRRSCVDKYAGLEVLNMLRCPPYDLSRLGLADKLLVNKPGSSLTRWAYGTPSTITKKPKH